MELLIGLIILALLGYWLYISNNSKKEAGVKLEQSDPVISAEILPILTPEPTPAAVPIIAPEPAIVVDNKEKAPTKKPRKKAVAKTTTKKTAAKMTAKSKTK